MKILQVDIEDTATSNKMSPGEVVNWFLENGTDLQCDDSQCTLSLNLDVVTTTEPETIH